MLRKKSDEKLGIDFENKYCYLADKSKYFEVKFGQITLRKTTTSLNVGPHYYQTLKIVTLIQTNINFKLLTRRFSAGLDKSCSTYCPYESDFLRCLIMVRLQILKRNITHSATPRTAYITIQMLRYTVLSGVLTEHVNKYIHIPAALSDRCKPSKQSS